MNGELRQDDSTDRLTWGFWLINYISTFATLKPGDLDLDGTPTGAGVHRNPSCGSSPATSWRQCRRSAPCAIRWTRLARAARAAALSASLHQLGDLAVLRTTLRVVLPMLRSSAASDTE